MNKDFYAVILAGGSGTRFWPMSRKIKPKQFLEITGRGTLLEETLKRISSKILHKNIFIVTNNLYKKAIEQHARQFKIPNDNILFEPEGKNTAPAICWAANHIHRMNMKAVTAVFPSDHLILNEKKFSDVLAKAFRLAQKNYLVTLGIVPTRPETGFGYLKTVSAKGILQVDKFTEKPSLAQAKKFVKSKNNLWNSGMFIWKASVILHEFKSFLPSIYRSLSKATHQKHIQEIWKKLPSVSVDYGILEKSRKVVALPAEDIGWSDLGSWESLTDVLPKDNEGNILRGKGILLNCDHNLIWGGHRLIAGIGLKNFIVIDTPDALLICPKAMSQQVKTIVGILQKQTRREL